MDHSNLFHDALTKVHDIAKNGSRNTQAWLDVLEIVDAAMEEARRIDREREATSAEGVRGSTVEPPSGCEAHTLTGGERGGLG